MQRHPQLTPPLPKYRRQIYRHVCQRCKADRGTPGAVMVDEWELIALGKHGHVGKRRLVYKCLHCGRVQTDDGTEGGRPLSEDEIATLEKRNESRES